VWRIISDEDGQDMVEYALVLAAVGLALVASINPFAVAVSSWYGSMAETIRGFGDPDFRQNR
jgi:Flp pilus assembly pilin Flp